MRTIASVLTLAVVGLLLNAQIRMLRIKAAAPAAGATTFAFSPGNAGRDERSEVLAGLQDFQEGYRRRDFSQVGGFLQRLFSSDGLLILGTQPLEVAVGPAEAAELVGGDWRSWGDCTFDIEQAHVSVHEDTAWFASTGRVRFDLSRHLVLPLRLSGVMVRDAEGWRIRFLQFQLDLDNSFSLLILTVLICWATVLTITLAVRTGRRLRRPGRLPEESPGGRPGSRGPG
jgi:hypothetical protein